MGLSESLLETLHLLGAEGRCLVDNHSRRCVKMMCAVGSKGTLQQIVGVDPGKIGAAILLVGSGLATTQDQTLATLIEHLRGAGEQSLSAEIAVEADPNIGRVELRRIAREPPRNISGLVVETAE